MIELFILVCYFNIYTICIFTMSLRALKGRCNLIKRLRLTRSLWPFAMTIYCMRSHSLLRAKRRNLLRSSRWHRNNCVCIKQIRIQTDTNPLQLQQTLNARLDWLFVKGILYFIISTISEDKYENATIHSLWRESVIAGRDINPFVGARIGNPFPSRGYENRLL